MNCLQEPVKHSWDGGVFGRWGKPSNTIHTDVGPGVFQDGQWNKESVASHWSRQTHGQRAGCVGCVQDWNETAVLPRTHSSPDQVTAPTMREGDKMGPGSELEGWGEKWWGESSDLTFQDPAQ